MHNALAFVQPSSIEGLPIALLEALIAGRFPIVSDIPENLEPVTIGDEHLGLNVPVGNPVALGAAITEAIGSTDRAEVGRQLHDHVRETYDWAASRRTRNVSTSRSSDLHPSMTPASRGGSPPSLAVIVVTYNSGAMLPECLAALDRAIEGIGPGVQSPVDLVVVDNASRKRPVVADSPAPYHAAPDDGDEPRLLPRGEPRTAGGADRGARAPPQPRCAFGAGCAEFAPARHGEHECASRRPAARRRRRAPAGVSERAFHSPAREAVGSSRPSSSRSEPTGGEPRRPALHEPQRRVPDDRRGVPLPLGDSTRSSPCTSRTWSCAGAHMPRTARSGSSPALLHPHPRRQQRRRELRGLHGPSPDAARGAARVHPPAAGHRRAAALARAFMVVGAAIRVVASLLLRKPACCQAPGDARWSLRSGRPPDWPSRLERTPS